MTVLTWAHSMCQVRIPQFDPSPHGKKNCHECKLRILCLSHHSFDKLLFLRKKYFCKFPPPLQFRIWERFQFSKYGFAILRQKSRASITLFPKLFSLALGNWGGFFPRKSLKVCPPSDSSERPFSVFFGQQGQWRWKQAQQNIQIIFRICITRSPFRMPLVRKKSAKLREIDKSVTKPNFPLCFKGWGFFWEGWIISWRCLTSHPLSLPLQSDKAIFVRFGLEAVQSPSNVSPATMVTWKKLLKKKLRTTPTSQNLPRPPRMFH